MLDYSTVQTIYCEQPLFNQFFEPLNTTTNIFYLLVAVYAWRQMALPVRIRMYFAITIGLLFLGSSAWHFYRSPMTLLSDVLPIYLILIGLLYFETRASADRHMQTFLILLSLFVITTVAALALDPIKDNAGESYAVLLCFWLSALVFFRRTDQTAKLKWYSLALVCFAIAYTFRQLDPGSCAYTPTGTHFMWHTMNAFTLFFALQGFKQHTT